jgi:hypothetical protein
MPIFQFPNTIPKPTTVPCTLCTLAVVPAKATVAMIDAHNQQMFACNAHFWDHGWYFIDAWISFMTEERMKLLINRRQVRENLYGWE